MLQLHLEGEVVGGAHAHEAVVLGIEIRVGHPAARTFGVSPERGV